MAEFEHYIGIIKPIREGFFENPTEKETEIMKNHYNYLKYLMEDDKLQLAGPVLNPKDPFGVIILKTASKEEAEKLLYNDPSVKNKVQKVIKLEPFRLSLFNSKK
jgi:uncharacterized protein YciI